MTRRIMVSIALALAVAAGFAVGYWWPPAGGDMPMSQAGGEREILYWRAPMDPNYRRDEPGKSPMGMDLVPVYADEMQGQDSGVVSISPRVVSNLGVRTAAVERGALPRRIETVGYVGYDEETLLQINTRVDGWIEHLAVKSAGDPVRRGQVLFELYSPTLVNAQQEHIAAMNSRNDALHEASLERLRALGMTPAEIDRLHEEQTVEQRIRVFAEKDGVVAHLGVREGVYVTPATNVMAIAELDRVWVLAEVFERQAAWVEPGQRAEVELDYLPGRRWEGTVGYVYPELDPQTRTLTVRLRFDNAARALRPNMFARVTIYGTETAPVVHVPREAVIRGGAADRVVLALGDGRFRAQPVELGIESGDRVEIRAGLADGDRVVTSGQFLIDSESNIDSALARFDAGTEAGTEAGMEAGIEAGTETGMDSSMETGTGTDTAAGAAAEPAMAPGTNMPAPAPRPERATVSGIVRGVDAAGRRITLEHAPVEVWSWPAMTMGFDAAEGLALEGLENGQAVEAVVENRDGRYAILEIAPAADRARP